MSNRAGPRGRLAKKVGAADLAAEHGTGRGEPGAKVMSLVAGMAAGADSIDALDVQRHAGAALLFTGLRAPSTLGTFPRGPSGMFGN